MVAILALDSHGIPRKWISVKDAILHYAKDQIAWEAGIPLATLYGGIRRIDGIQSSLSTNSIIAIKSQGMMPVRMKKVILTNKTLFGRDDHLCAYCGRTFDERLLSRDHVIPSSKGGLDIWTNVVTACKKCNQLKDNQTPEQADMPLLYLPYVPSHHENLILANRRILSCQMQFLLSGVPKGSRLHS